MYGNEYEDGKVLGQCGNMKALPRTMMMMPILLMRMRMNMAMGGAWAMTLYCCPSKGIAQNLIEVFLTFSQTVSFVFQIWEDCTEDDSRLGGWEGCENPPNN